jgi:predicted DNA-binding transcriptional regulator
VPYRNSESVLTTLGFPPRVARLYERLLLLDGMVAEEVAGGFDITVAELRERTAMLEEQGIVTFDPVEGRMIVQPPTAVVADLIELTAAGVALATQKLREIIDTLPYLAGIAPARASVAPSTSDPIDGEVDSDPDGPEAVRAIIRQSIGDLRWLRPDQWRLPWEDDMSVAVGEAIESGRRVLAIYPVRVLAEAPEIIEHRTSIGEEIRLLPELPTRMMVIGASHAFLPEPLGFSASPRSVIRQRGIVELAALFFDNLWDQAAAVDDGAVEASSMRPFLLAELARGSQDEQIARRLGMSVRTVRRRVAEIMDELGAHSRFQAGVEAARRGWLG